MKSIKKKGGLSIIFAQSGGAATKGFMAERA
jgi:hypothetical protein